MMMMMGPQCNPHSDLWSLFVGGPNLSSASDCASVQVDEVHQRRGDTLLHLHLNSKVTIGGRRH